MLHVFASFPGPPGLTVELFRLRLVAMLLGMAI